MDSIGYICLIIAWVFSLYGMVISLLGARLKRRSYIEIAQNCVFTTTIFQTIVVGVLLYLLSVSDFSLEYVVNYTNRDLPIIYKLTALWGGQAGSLLLWSWLLTIFGTIQWGISKMPKVIIPSPLREHANDQREVIIEGSSFGEAMKGLWKMHPGLKAATKDSPLLSVFINNKLVRTGINNWDTLLINHDDEITLMIPLAGG